MPSNLLTAGTYDLERARSQAVAARDGVLI
jgi:hypothetical protein